MTIRVHIERLVLDGVQVGPGQGAQVKAAVASELQRLLAANGLTPGISSWGAVPAVTAESIQLSEDNHPRDVGHRIAQSVYGELGQ
jgi:hypothetical protein